MEIKDIDKALLLKENLRSVGEQLKEIRKSTYIRLYRGTSQNSSWRGQIEEVTEARQFQKRLIKEYEKQIVDIKKEIKKL